MASNTLYPPIVNDIEPAFVVNPTSSLSPGGTLKVYFSYSALSSDIDYNNIWVHATILRKDGTTVMSSQDDVDPEDPDAEWRLRSAKMILNLKPQKDTSLGNNYWYITLTEKDLKSMVHNYNNYDYYGWIPGWVYKIQIRLSDAERCNVPNNQQSWLYQNADHFSEWSTIIYTKAISEMKVKNYYDIPSIPERDAYPDIIAGEIKSLVAEANENYSYFETWLYKADDNWQVIELLDYSGQIYRTERSPYYFEYQFKVDFELNQKYIKRLQFVTDNGYISEVKEYTFTYDESTYGENHYCLKTVEDYPIEEKSVIVQTGQDNYKIYQTISSLMKEEDEGRIGLKICYDGQLPINAEDAKINLVIKRASEIDNFKTWETIKYIQLNASTENDFKAFPVIYDYTIESDTYYQYGIQKITFGEMGGEIDFAELVYSPMNKTKKIQRCFNYSYLIGEDNKQLKLQFDNTINNFRDQMAETKLETIGNRYPFIHSNKNLKYKTFPLTGLITFNMDEAETFINAEAGVYGNEQAALLHQNESRMYNYGYERRFRNKVLEFLEDRKPKLFKSPSEGNILIRLMNVGCTPIQSLNKMIYNFSGEANEIDDNKLSSYIKYGITYPGTYQTDVENIHKNPIEMETISGNIEWIVSNGHVHNYEPSLTPNYEKNQSQEELSEDQGEEAPPALGGV